MRPSRTPILLVLFAIPLLTTQLQSQGEPRSISAAARTYLSTALDTLEAITVRGDTITWRNVRDSAFLFAAGAQRPSDTYGAIAWALHRVNKHSFLQARRPGATSALVDDRIGYLHVPQWSSADPSLADSLQTALKRLDSAGVCGWIVDARGNGGGNMWPMLAGIGPLLDDTIIGAFGTGAGADRWFYARGVSGILHANGTLDTITRTNVSAAHIHNARASVAVLFDGGTASSGEALALAFRGRQNSRSFGEASAGFTTANRGSRLPDGANMVVTTGYEADRLGRPSGERLEPDVTTFGGAPGWPFATDGTAIAAARWLETQQNCTARSAAP